jgi:hypothetical protein
MPSSGCFPKGNIPWNKGQHIIREPLEDRFWRKVHKTDGCWLWIAFKNNQGYGVIRENRINILAHRMSLKLSGVDLPDDKNALHKCDVPACVNPEHLYVGTQKENARDVVIRGRHRNQNTGKTHCVHGHEFTKENTFIEKKGRRCRECNKIALRKRKIEKGY